MGTQEKSQWDGSFEHSKRMLKLTDKTTTILHSKDFVYLYLFHLGRSLLQPLIAFNAQTTTAEENHTLTHLSWIDLPTLIRWTSPFPILGVLGGIFLDLYVVSDLDLYCLLMSHKKDARFIWVHVNYWQTNGCKFELLSHPTMSLCDEYMAISGGKQHPIKS